MPEACRNGERLLVVFMKNEPPEMLAFLAIDGGEECAFDNKEPVNLPFVHMPRLDDIRGAPCDINLLDLACLRFAGDLI